MRWGISHEMSNSHMSTTVCLNEIKNCQNFSTGPNFIVKTRYLNKKRQQKIKFFIRLF